MSTSDLLRQTLAERGISKRGLARMICDHLSLNGDRAKLEKWERAVYRWTSKKNPGGMEDDNAELVATVLGLPADTFKREAYIRGLEEQNQRLTVEREQRLARLEADVAELQERLESEQP